jgi:hypothetical protein
MTISKLILMRGPLNFRQPVNRTPCLHPRIVACERSIPVSHKSHHHRFTGRHSGETTTPKTPEEGRHLGPGSR